MSEEAERALAGYAKMAGEQAIRANELEQTLSAERIEHRADLDVLYESLEHATKRAEAAEADFQNCAHELEISDAAADRAVARASRLEAALLKYGSHKVGCELYYEAGGSCNCGFDAALSGEGEK